MQWQESGCKIMHSSVTVECVTGAIVGIYLERESKQKETHSQVE